MKSPRCALVVVAAASAAFLCHSTTAAPPPNDNFVDAQLLSGTSGSGTAVMAEATIEPGEPTHLGYPPNRSVWYKLVAPVSGTLLFHKSDAINGALVGIYRGTAFDNLIELTRRPAPPEYDLNSYKIPVEEGATYYISFNDPTDPGLPPMSFDWEVATPPPNDAFANADAISGESGAVSASTLLATVESAEPHATEGNSIWYVWTAPRTGSFGFTVSGEVSSYHSYTGSTLDSLAELAHVTSYSGIRATAGERYYIQISGTGKQYAGSGRFTLTWAPGPVNDDFANATELSGSEGSISGNTRGATEEAGEPATIAGYPGAESIWYRWTARDSRWYSFQLGITQGASLLAVYTESETNALSRVASKFVTPSYGGSSYSDSVTFHADAGMTYAIAVAIYDTSTNPSAPSADSAPSARDVRLSWQAGSSPADAALLNLSTRGNVGTEDDALIGGFIIKGNEPKKIMIRGIGPSLDAGGTPIPGRLLDPVLELHDNTGAVIFTNDDWVDSPQKQAIVDSTIPPKHDKEPAIVATLPAGAYTAVLRGANGGMGIALIELYDLDVAAAARLVNMSTRGKVETGDNVLIGGFIVGGSLPAKLAIRALGWSLAKANPPVNNALYDPEFAVYDSNGRSYPITANQNWTWAVNERELSDAGLAPRFDWEPAVIVTLPPGNYTAVVRGENSSTGVSLVEIYNLN